jgi:ribosomal protein S18 acetylase RimI-like enzyme
VDLWVLGRNLTGKSFIRARATEVDRAAGLTILRVSIRIEQNCTNVRWEKVAEILSIVGMASFAPEFHRKAFESSHSTVFAYHAGELIGCGRAISDGICQAAIYDVAVLPEYQGKGIGRTIVEALCAPLEHCNVILYAMPGKENFYQKLGFRSMKTAMARFVRPDVMAQKGFTN